MVAAEIAVHDIRPVQTLQLLPVARQTDIVAVGLREGFRQPALHFGAAAVLLGQDFLVQLTNTLLQLGLVCDLLLTLTTQRRNLVADLGDQLLLLIQPQQVEMGNLLVDRVDLLLQFRAVQKIRLPLRYDVSHIIWCQHGRFLLRNCLPDGFPVRNLGLQTGGLLLQTSDTQRDRMTTDERILHTVSAERTRHIALIQHTLIRDGGPIPAQLLNRVAAHHAPEQIIHVGSRKRVPGLHLFRKTAALRVDMLTLAQRADIDQTVGVQAFFPLEFVVNTQSLLVICRFNQKIKLLVVEIAFHSTAPALIFNFQHIRENIYRNRRSRLLLQFLRQLGTERQQPARIVLDVPAQIGKRSLLFGQLLLQLCNLIAKLMRRLRQRVRQGRCRLPGVLEYGLLLREDCAFAARQPCVGTLHLLCRLLHRNKHLLGVPCKRGLAQVRQPQRLPLDLKCVALHLLHQLALLGQQRLLLVAQPLALLIGVALRIIAVQLTAAFLLRLHLPGQILNRGVRRGQLGQAVSLFLLAAVDLRLHVLLLRPLHKEGLHAPTVHRARHFAVQRADLLQRGQLFLLLLRQLLVPLVVADVLLHSFDIRLIRNIADIFGDKLLNIHDWAERHRLFHHAEHLLVVHVPPREHVAAVLPLGIVHLGAGKILLEEFAQVVNIHRLAVLDKAVFRQFSDIDKEMIVLAAVTAAIEHHAAHETIVLHIVLKFTDNIGRKVLASAGIRVILVHIGTQIAVQRAL